MNNCQSVATNSIFNSRTFVRLSDVTALVTMGPSLVHLHVVLMSYLLSMARSFFSLSQSKLDHSVGQISFCLREAAVVKTENCLMSRNSFTCGFQSTSVVSPSLPASERSNKTV